MALLLQDLQRELQQTKTQRELTEKVGPPGACHLSSACGALLFSLRGRSFAVGFLWSRKTISPSMLPRLLVLQSPLQRLQYSRCQGCAGYMCQTAMSSLEADSSQA